MLRSSIIQPLVRGWAARSFRNPPRHHVAATSPHLRLSPTKARYPDIQARALRKKAGSKEKQRKRLSDSSTDDRNDKRGGSSSASPVFFILLLLFFAGARDRRERREREEQQDESPVDANGEVDLEGTGD